MFVDLLNKFTTREKKICRLLCEGLTHKEIAVRLHTTQATVSTGIRLMCLKTGSKNSTMLAVEYALADRWVRLMDGLRRNAVAWIGESDVD